LKAFTPLPISTTMGSSALAVPKSIVSELSEAPACVLQEQNSKKPRFAPVDR
jgi:hypothetical protein